MPRPVVLPAHTHAPGQCHAAGYRRHVDILAGPHCGDEACFAEDAYPMDDSTQVHLGAYQPHDAPPCSYGPRRWYSIIRPVPGCDLIAYLTDQEALG